MKYLVAIGAFGMIAGAFYMLLGVRPLCEPYTFARSMSSAHGYWIEFEEQGKCGIRHKFGRKWPLDFDDWEAGRNAVPRYAGQSGRLWQIQIPRIKDPFLLFDSCSGASSMRRVLFRISEDGLVPAAEVITVSEIHGDEEKHLLLATFEDVDGDGVPELKECHREWTTNAQGELVDEWAIRTVYHRWNGTQFCERYERRQSNGVVGPLQDWHP